VGILDGRWVRRAVAGRIVTLACMVISSLGLGCRAKEK
jgi:hypothetical protein